MEEDNYRKLILDFPIDAWDAVNMNGATNTMLEKNNTWPQLSLKN
jgi:hypothetical protein